MKKSLIITLLLPMLVASKASATVYSFSYTNGVGSATGSITTDGTIGNLSSSANIVDWNIVLNGNPGITFNLLGPLSGSNSAVSISTNTLSATATDLMFDFSSNGFLAFQNPFFGSGRNVICFDGADRICNGIQGVSFFTSASASSVAKSGIQSIAAVAAAPVPEPENFAMFGLGLALISYLRRKNVVAYS